MIIESFVVGMLQTNCYLLGDNATHQAVVIDPGGESERIARRIKQMGLKLVAILNTHGHFDHITDAWALKERMGGEIYLHSNDEPISQQSMAGMGAMFGLKKRSAEDKIDRYLQEGDSLVFGGIILEVLETPGHTPGHVSFHMRDAGIVFVGDTLFAGSIGRTDFPGGSHNQLIRSVREKIFPLDGKTVVHPGHGPETTVEREKKTNPFFR
jgi:glyoxylase-like metal-dependent hydrolase (beta-lactamase superfamily II)